MRWPFASRLAGVLVIAVVLALAIVGVRIWSDAENTKWQHTMRQMMSFRGVLQKCSALSQKAPGSLAEAIGQIQASDECRQELQDRCGLIVGGRDAWGNPFIYEVNATKTQATLRSMGQNGIDESGGGDDIQDFILLTPPETGPDTRDSK